jgi:hypothetical protein
MASHRVQILGVLQLSRFFTIPRLTWIEQSTTPSAPRVDCRISDAVGVVQSYSLDGQRGKSQGACYSMEDLGHGVKSFTPSDRQNAWRRGAGFLVK